MHNIEDNDSIMELQSERRNLTIKKNSKQIKILAVVLGFIFIMISTAVVFFMYAENVYLYTGVEGPSMKPTINASSPTNSEPYDYAYVNTYQKGERGDIIVIKHQMNDLEYRFVIKRLIGIAGDKIVIDNRNPLVTRVYRNDVLITEDYIKDIKFSGLSGDRNGVTTLCVPENCIFYMGDNRNDSEDCRSYADAVNPYCELCENIVGRVDYIVPNGLIKKGDGKDFERFWNGCKEIWNKIF